jgi:hypothetical protein
MADELASSENGVGDAFIEAGGDDSWEFGATSGNSNLSGGNSRSASRVGPDAVGNDGEGSAHAESAPDMAEMPSMGDFEGLADMANGEAAGPPLTLGDLSAEEIELLEILVLHAELAPLAFRRIRVEDLRGKPAKTLFNTFRLAREMGESADFRSVLSELDDPRLKSLLIQLDESATRKAVVASLGPDVRLTQLCERFEARREEKVLREELTEMERGTMDYASQMATLLKQFELAKKRQGLTSPMEG